MLERIFQGLIQWIYGMFLEMVEFFANALLQVFSMDLAYFERVMPVTTTISGIITASGWALLIGNLVFQALKGMMSGLGFEAEDPKTLFARSFVFSFLLLGSRQIADIGFGLAGRVMIILQMPSAVSIRFPTESMFGIGAAWLLVVIVGFVLMWQIVKLFFVVGERYFIVGLLTIMAPWAFAMGGSRNTADIFKGWVRMYASMCVLLVMNVIMLQLLLSAMGHMPSGVGVIPWLIMVVAIAKVGRTIDSMVARIGLNPAVSSDGRMGRMPGMLSIMAIKSIASSVTRAAGSSAAPAKTSGGGAARAGGGNKSPVPNKGGSPSNRSNTQSSSSNSSTTTTPQEQTHNVSNAGTVGTTPANAASPTSAASPNTGTAGIVPATGAKPDTAGMANATGQQSGKTNNLGTAGNQYHSSGGDTVKSGQNSTTQQQSSSAQNNNSRRSSVTQNNPANRPGLAGTGGNVRGVPTPGQGNTPSVHPPVPRASQVDPNAPVGTAGMARQGEHKGSQPTRYSAIPPEVRGGIPGTAGTASNTSNTRFQQGGANVNAQNQNNVNANQNSSENYSGPNSGAPMPPKANTPTGSGNSSASAPRGTAGTDSRRSSATPDKSAANSGGHTSISSSNTANPRSSAIPSRDSRNTSPTSATQHSGGKPESARQEGAKNVGNSGNRKQPPHGTAGNGANPNRYSNADRKPGIPNNRPANIGYGPNRGGNIGNSSKSKARRGKNKIRKRKRGA